MLAELTQIGKLDTFGFSGEAKCAVHLHKGQLVGGEHVGGVDGQDGHRQAAREGEGHDIDRGAQRGSNAVKSLANRLLHEPRGLWVVYAL